MHSLTCANTPHTHTHTHTHTYTHKANLEFKTTTKHLYSWNPLEYLKT
jgi:hypothetical protein